MSDVVFHSPRSLGELFERMADWPDYTFLAGGTDLVPRMNRNRHTGGLSFPGYGNFGLPEKHLIYIGHAGLSYIREEADAVVIGAATTLTDILESDAVNRRVPVLAEAVSRLAGRTIRNTATLGGNISNASPAGDSLPPLYVLGATVVLASQAGERVFPVARYITGPGRTLLDKREVLKEIVVPAQKGVSAFLKTGRRKTETLSVVNAAVRAVLKDGVIEEASVAVGACGPTVILCEEAARRLIGQAPSAALFAEAADAASEAVCPIDDARSSAWYRKRMAGVSVKRALTRALAPDGKGESR